MNSMRELLSTRQNLCPGLGNHDSGPSVFACDQDVAPSKRRDVFEQVLWRLDACAFAFLDCASELVGVPVDDGCSEEVQSGNPEVLGLACPIADFALAADPQGALQGMMRLALVQARTGPPLHVGIQQPVDDEERPFDPSDFTKGNSKIVLARI